MKKAIQHIEQRIGELKKTSDDLAKLYFIKEVDKMNAKIQELEILLTYLKEQEITVESLDEFYEQCDAPTIQGSQFYLRGFADGVTQKEQGETFSEKDIAIAFNAARERIKIGDYADYSGAHDVKKKKWENSKVYIQSLKQDHISDVGNKVDTASTNYFQVIEQTHEEKVAMYMKCEKEKLIEMLIQCNTLLDSSMRVKTYDTPKQNEQSESLDEAALKEYPIEMMLEDAGSIRGTKPPLF